MVKISIIIPCYNHGKYLPETLQSIANSKTTIPYEIIIVNDGSTDSYTIEYLTDLKEKGYTVIFQENKGVCETRNVGIRHAKGEYILPIDSDNKINPDYIEKTAAILDNQPDISIVYCNSILIGDQSGTYLAGDFNLQRLMLSNFIDNCSLYRKSMWEKLGGYESSRLIAGLEDWEFWLRAAFAGNKFYYINEALFEYRVLANSGIRSLNSSKLKNNQIMDYFAQKMPTYFGRQYVDEYILTGLRSAPIGFLGKLILKAYFPKKFNRLVEKGKLRKYI